VLGHRRPPEIFERLSVRLGKGKLNGEAVDDLRRLDLWQVRRSNQRSGGRIFRDVEGELHVFGSDRAAIMPFDIPAQMQRDIVWRHIPALGQVRAHAQLLVVLNEGGEECVINELDRVLVARGDGVYRLKIGVHADRDGAAVPAGRATVAPACRDDQRNRNRVS
jgi:hypothetical protein